jgi:hypothetical protein
VDAEGNTALHTAMMAKQQTVVSALIELGAAKESKNFAGLTVWDLEGTATKALDERSILSKCARFEQLVESQPATVSVGFTCSYKTWQIIKVLGFTTLAALAAAAYCIIYKKLLCVTQREEAAVIEEPADDNEVNAGLAENAELHSSSSSDVDSADHVDAQGVDASQQMNDSTSGDEFVQIGADEYDGVAASTQQNTMGHNVNIDRPSPPRRRSGRRSNRPVGTNYALIFGAVAKSKAGSSFSSQHRR